MIVIVDFGSQTAHLIGRRIREQGVAIKIVEPSHFDGRTSTSEGMAGIIFSGGPASVYEKNAPSVNPSVFDFGIPILGICYGQQLLAHLLGGKVKPGNKKEYGPATILVEKDSELLKGTASEFQVWMSHGDEVTTLPRGFEKLGRSSTISFAAIQNKARKIFGIQFHPEVVHTQFGEEILKNFLEICGQNPKKHVIDTQYVQNLVYDIRESLKNAKAICALSGGVDSSVAALLVHKAIGKNLTCLYIDAGIMRQGETETLRKIFKDHFHMNIRIINAKDIFLKRLRKVTDPEKKRMIIGRTFIEVFNKHAKRLGATFLVQGTIYPDVIESKGTRHSHKIKSHHNVGGLPAKMKLTLVEPLRIFYKDEVRKIGTILGLPDLVTKRHPFPGPALAVRIIGDVTNKKLEMLRRADAIVRNETTDAKLDHTLWQVFAILTGIKTTGVRGDRRAYGETIAIRAVEATDAMTAHFARLPYELLDKIAVRIVNEIPSVNRVVYDITNKPPATIEWE